jgi:cell division protein FtsB
MRTAVRALLVAVVVGGILFLFVLPARTWLEQGKAISTARHQAQVLSQENQVLTKRSSQLQSSGYVEQIARQEYGLIMPGEQAYNILLPMARTTTTTLPTRHHGQS